MPEPALVRDALGSAGGDRELAGRLQWAVATHLAGVDGTAGVQHGLATGRSGLKAGRFSRSGCSSFRGDLN